MMNSEEKNWQPAHFCKRNSSSSPTLILPPPKGRGRIWDLGGSFFSLPFFGESLSSLQRKGEDLGKIFFPSKISFPLLDCNTFLSIDKNVLHIQCVTHIIKEGEEREGRRGKEEESLREKT